MPHQRRREHGKHCCGKAASSKAHHPAKAETRAKPAVELRNAEERHGIDGKCHGILYRCQAIMVDQHEGGIRQINEQGRKTETAHEDEAEEMTVLQQPPVTAQCDADIALKPRLDAARFLLRGRNQYDADAGGKQHGPENPAPAEKLMMMEPVSGARIGEIEKTSIKSDIRRAASTPI